ncbi:MAG: hypothetical protein EAZ36_01010 [Verrucomicrobia bacterium]|nr:MAG: hypothetical protein EAZ36_01010 [Verrucomicrobiota bacterium]
MRRTKAELPTARRRTAHFKNLPTMKKKSSKITKIAALRSPTTSERALGRTVPITVYLTKRESTTLRERSRTLGRTMAFHLVCVLADSREIDQLCAESLGQSDTV